jgi:hypothetical protein
VAKVHPTDKTFKNLRIPSFCQNCENDHFGLNSWQNSGIFWIEWKVPNCVVVKTHRTKYDIDLKVLQVD